MKRITMLFDDETLYKRLKVEAAKEGRPVKAVVAEAISDWLRKRGEVSAEVTQRRLDALRSSKELRAAQTQQTGETILDTLDWLREQRS
ncbi:MAG: hypothetical protein EXR50_02800 [Dehalococcoidia bacterium]|nr:hypothetical protein [Dehalococcoidia bacterium]